MRKGIMLGLGLGLTLLGPVGAGADPGTKRAPAAEPRATARAGRTPAIAPSRAPRTGRGGADARRNGAGAGRGARLGLGRIDFPVSTPSAKAQAHMTNGVLALHSFFYDEAEREFRAAHAADPDLAMAGWGLLLSEYRRGQLDEARARAAVALIDRARRKPTPRERAYLDAARTLVGKEPLAVRRVRFADALERVARAQPDDLEARMLHVAARWWTSVDLPRNEARRIRLRLAAVALEAFHAYPDHPGAAHYVIHTLDDPEHAPLALAAARRYAAIAPEAYHARHMPAHIFAQLGMWRDAIASCESAWAASVAWARRAGESAAAHDLHSGHWLIMLYLEVGQRARAEEVLGRMARAARTGAPQARAMYVLGVAAYLSRTEAWDRLSILLAPVAGMPGRTAPGRGHGHAPAATRTAPVPSRRQLFPAAELERLLVEELSARAAIARGDLDEARDRLARVRALPEAVWAHKYLRDSWTVAADVLEARLHVAGRRWVDAVAAARRAVARDASVVGEGGLYTDAAPAEVLGEILLAAGQVREAQRVFGETADRFPGRTRALLGLARASQKMGERDAARAAYARLAEIWKDAGPGWPGVAETRRALRRRTTPSR